MGPRFTPRQRMAIDLRNCNILVSASAGAGKTAVLTERIVNLLLDPEHQTDIDKIVIVTYTRAAAAEMRSRIAEKLTMRLKETPENTHIQKQLALIAHAHISTIDSFCRSIVSNYFYTIGLDPAFRIVDENEIKLIEDDIVSALLEDEYVRAEESFINMIETFAPGKSDKPVEKLIINLYEMSQSHAFPYEWLEECCNKFDIEGPEQFEESDWFLQTGIMNHIKNVIKDCIDKEQKAVDMLDENKVRFRLDMESEDYTYDEKAAGALADLREFIEAEKGMLESLVKAESYMDISCRITRLEFGRFPNKKLNGEVKVIKDEAKGLRDDVKKAITKLTGSFFYQSPELMAEDIRACGEPVKELIRVTKEFMRRYEQYKRDSNIADFNDIEHYALNILLKNVDGKIVRTDVANELMDRYEYILIDEYQDSNEVQETILSGISRIPIGKPNMFMVGDVKQSIYQFRLAKPDIFEAKLSAYPTAETIKAGEDDAPGKRVLLKKNFRSTGTILKTINYIFPNIMRSFIGKVEYDETHFFDIDENPELEACEEPVEAIYVTGKDEYNEYGKMQIEALAIAGRIKELVNPETGMKITESDVTRQVNYSDIVILLRSMKGWAEAFVEILTTKGIPVVAQEQTGYFSAKEIQTMLAMLKIIDNPRQDIPLTGVLRSVFGDFSDNELAIIRTTCDGDMYNALCAAAESEKNYAVAEKCQDFLKMLEGYRKKASYMTVYDLIQELFNEKDYYNCMKAMPAGGRRAGNLLMFADKALAYENNDKRGLSSFIRYIDRMQKSNIDFGEAKQSDGRFGAVKIMSIHKSKGLEFPVVFVSGMGKRVNLLDARNDVIVHAELGPVPDYFDSKKRIKRGSLLKKAVSRKITNDVIGEEIRILYVALTRARTKLIMTGYMPEEQEKLDSKYRQKSNSYLEMIGANNCYYDWVSPCFARHPAWAETFGRKGGYLGADLETTLYPRMEFRCVSADDIICRVTEEIMSKEIRKTALEMEAAKDIFDEETFKCIQNAKEYKYPYAEETAFAMKVSVSDIKHRAAVLEDEETVKASWNATERPVYVPSFMKEETEKAITGADRGTMYHALMEHLDIENITTTDDIENRIKALISKGILDEAAIEDNVISKKKILAFCNSNVAARMIEAGRKGLVAREQPFVMGVSACRVYPESNSEETIIVQGIIDVYFEEEDGIVLLDYKTDRIGKNEADKLVNRYRVQMDCYREAIEKSRAKPVKEIILYSFSLNKEIRVDIDG